MLPTTFDSLQQEEFMLRRHEITRWFMFGRFDTAIHPSYEVGGGD